MVIEVKARAEGRSSLGLRHPQPVQSVMRHEENLCLMLELFDENLTSFEKSLNGELDDCDYDACFKATAFLDAIYLFSRMLLDSVAGVVRHRDFHEPEKGRELPKSFDDIYKKSVKGELPGNLNKVFSECETWFPQLKERRDNIVHYYETNLIGIDKSSEGGTTAMQFSPRKKTPKVEDLRSYIGVVMAGCQRLIDRLLDYWDEMFRSRYGITKPANTRTQTIFEGRRASILWWAYQYGGYRNDNMVVGES